MLVFVQGMVRIYLFVVIECDSKFEYIWKLRVFFSSKFQTTNIHIEAIYDEKKLIDHGYLEAKSLDELKLMIPRF